MNRTQRLRTLPLACGLVILSACTSSTPTDLGVSITSPAVGQPVTGTVQVQVAVTDPAQARKVTLYARSQGSTIQGVALGSSTTQPFVISWYTPGLPSGAALEIYADAEATNGGHVQSDPVKVSISNSTAPALSYLTAYTLPAAMTTASLGGAPRLPQLFPEGKKVRVPQNASVSPRLAPAGLSAQASGLTYALEWAWQPVAGATGYRIYQATDDLVGPYTNVYNQLATAGTQRYSRTVTDAKVGGKYYGTVTAYSNGIESSVSNADDATFLPAQTLNTPANGAMTSDGRPNLSWNSTPGAVGYLWYISKQPQATATPADWVCTNSPDSTDSLTALYPTSCPKLTTGTYYWWVSGISFNVQGQPDAFTLSPDRTIIAP